MLAAISRLDAINLVLGALGLAPRSSLEADETSDVASAIMWLDVTSKACQARGWCWNTDKCMSVTPDENHLLTVAPNVISFDFVPEYCGPEDPVLRGVRVYDRKNHTYEFQSPSYLADIITLLDWDELPQPARWYIAMTAARRAAASIGDMSVVRFTEADEKSAYADLQQYDAEQTDANFLRPSTC